jgi:hypothetical protein
MLAMILLLAACRAITTESRSLFRLAAATVMQPFVEAQASAALTQSSFRKAPAVPAPSATKTARTVALPKAEVVEALPAQRFIRAKLAPAPSSGRYGCVKKPIVVLYTPS